jgi:hypothetical protein
MLNPPFFREVEIFLIMENFILKYFSMIALFTIADNKEENVK